MAGMVGGAVPEGGTPAASAGWWAAMGKPEATAVDLRATGVD